MIKIKKISEILILLVLFFMPGIVCAVTFTPSNSTPADLLANLQNEVDSRIVGVTANDTSKKLWTTRGNETSAWTWNPNVWTNNGDNIDWTGVSPWNSTGGYTMAGVLVSPRHIVFAKHFQINTGSTIVFVTSGGDIVTKTVTGTQSVSTHDITVGVLDSAVPDTITYYPVPSTIIWEQYLRDGISETAYNLPLAVFDQEDKILVKNTQKRLLFGNSSLIHDAGSGKRGEFDETLIGGDSGNPAFAIIGGKPALLQTAYTPSMGPNYSYYRDSINTIMDSLSGSDEYDLSDINLSGFDAPIVISQTQDFVLPLNSATGTVAGTVAIEHNVEGETPFFSINSGNSDSALSINSSTGVVTVASSTLISLSNNFPRIINLKVSENDVNGRASYATTTIAIESYPIFSEANYSFDVDENEDNGTEVGTVSATDPDRNTLSYSIISGNTNSTFSINPSTGVISVNNSANLNFEETPIFNLTVRVTETNGGFGLTTDVSVGISLNDLSMGFDSLSYSFELAEDSSNDTSVGTVGVDVYDTGNFNGTYYSIISGNEDEIFEINSSNGEIKAIDTSALDYTVEDLYSLDIGVSDTDATSTVLAETLVYVVITEEDRPDISFDSRTSSVAEGNSHNVSVSLSHSFSRDIILNYAVSNVSAINGSDFSLATTSITIPAGQTSSNINISILSDSISESSETFIIRLSDSNYGTIISPSQHSVTITNSSNSSSGGGGSGSSKKKTEEVAQNIVVTEIPQNSISSGFRDLQLGDIGSDVHALQVILNLIGNTIATEGPGSPGNETEKFGAQTRQALIKFQIENGITPALGYFGPKTREVLIKKIIALLLTIS